MIQSSSSTSTPSASVRSSAPRRAFGLALARAAVLLVAASAGLGACKKSDAAGTAPVGSGSAAVAGKAPVTLLNVSYDPTRELYQEFNAVFAKYWKDKTGQDVKVNQSHGGGGKQARAVLDGLEADVVTLALGYDVAILYDKGKLIPENWQNAPARIALLTLRRSCSWCVKATRRRSRIGMIITREGVQVITPSPKTSGGARWNYLAAWGYALKQPGGDDSKAREFMSKLYKNVPVLDSGARGATTTFVERKIGDVLITWENEAILSVHEFAKDNLELVIPSVSVLTEPPVTIVDKNVDKHGTREVAEAYLKYLYTPEGQEVVAKHYYRPRDAAVLAKHKLQFPDVSLFTVDELFGGWSKAQPTHFNDGGIFDQIYQPKK